MYVFLVECELRGVAFIGSGVNMGTFADMPKKEKKGIVKYCDLHVPHPSSSCPYDFVHGRFNADVAFRLANKVGFGHCS